MLRYAAITGWGHCLPERVVTNKELELAHQHQRRVDLGRAPASASGASPGRAKPPPRSAPTAARRALACANLPAAQLDLVICATTTPDHLVPNTGSIVQQRLGATQAGAFDLNAACTGFVYALAVGTQFIRAGTRRVLVVGGETLSRFTNWDDRSTCVLFGDGAGAVVLEATDQECGVLSTVLGSRGDAEHLLVIEAGGSARPASAETVARGEHFVTMRGSDIFRTGGPLDEPAARKRWPRRASAPTTCAHGHCPPGQPAHPRLDAGGAWAALGEVRRQRRPLRQHRGRVRCRWPCPSS